MTIYFLFIFSISILAIFLLNVKDLKKRKKVLVAFFCLGVILIQGFRDISVGTDLASYIPMYHNARNYNLFLGEKILNYEFGYSLYSQIFSCFKINEHIYLGIVALTIIMPIGVIIYKYSKKAALSILTYITLGFFTFTFSGLRQAIAFGITFFSYKYICERNLKKFLFLLIIATTFHKTAIIFGLAYFIYNIKLKNIHIVVGSIIFFMIFILRAQIYSFIHFIWVGEMASGTATGAYTMLIVMVVVTIVAIILRPKEDKIINSTINYMIIAILIQIFASQSSVIMRAGYYYYIFIIILVPNIIAYQKNKAIRTWGSIIYVGLLLAFYYLTTANGYLNVAPYKFL